MSSEQRLPTEEAVDRDTEHYTAGRDDDFGGLGFADPAAAPPLERGPRFFLVEDNAVIRQNLVATLEELLDMQLLGHAADEASALEWLCTEAHAGCDLLIVDVFLNKGTGLEVLRQVRQRRPESRVVVLTNYATAEMRRRCLDLGADRVFDKSSELEDLIAYCEDLGREALGRGGRA